MWIHHSSSRLKLLEGRDRSFRRRVSTRWVLTRDEMTVGDGEIVPFARRTFVYTICQLRSINPRADEGMNEPFETHMCLQDEGRDPQPTRPSTLQLVQNIHGRLTRGGETGESPTLDDRLVLAVEDVREDCGTVTDRTDDSTILPNGRSDVLKSSRRRVVEKSSVAGGGEEDTVLGRVVCTGRRHVIEFLTEIARSVFPSLEIVSAQVIGCKGQPIGGIFPRLGGEVDLESGLGEYVERMQRLGDEEPGSLAVMKGSLGGGDGDDCTTGKCRCHL